MARHHSKGQGFCKRLRLFMLLCCLVAFPARAEPPADLYTVPDIAVNETAEDAGKARKVAHEKAQAQAFAALLDRLLPPRFRESAPAFSEEEIASAVQAIEIDGEKISGTAYQARVTTRFSADKIRVLLKSRNVEFAEKIAPPTLVVPMFQENNQVYLWEPENLWRAEWDKRAAASWAVPLVAPAGDLEDVRLLSARDVMLGEFRKVASLAERYRADEAVIMEAMVEEGSEEKPPVLNVLLRFLKGKQVKLEKNLVFEITEGEERAALLEKAALGVMHELEEQWKKQVEGKAPSLDSSALEIRAPFSGLAEWVEIKNRIVKVKAIKTMEVLSLAADHARILIRYDGDRADAFAMQLLASGLALRQDALGEWELHLLGGEQQP